MKKTALAFVAAASVFAAGCSATDKPASSSPLPSAVSPPTATPVPKSTEQPTITPSPTPSPTPTPSPAPVKKEYHMDKVYRIVPNDPNGNKKVVLLTFDDGPKDKTMLESMLATLDKHHAKAIFFVNGYRIKQNPSLLKIIQDHKQTIGNHSYDHIDLKNESNAKVDQQIGDVQKMVKELTGEAPQFFRPPFGSGSDYVKQKAKDEGLLYMTWSNGSLDWDASTKDKPEAVIENVMKQLHPGANILMHELPWTDQALDKLLTRIEEAGYSFVDPASIELEMR